MGAGSYQLYYLTLFVNFPNQQPVRLYMAFPAILGNVDKINPTIWRSYFSFFQGEKAANSELFKDFSTKKKWKRTSQMVVFILSSFLSNKDVKKALNALAYKQI